MTRADMSEAVDNMLRVLDVVDAFHTDTPDYAATILDDMGPDLVAEAALRLLDVLVHVVVSTPIRNGASVTAEDFTDYIRDMLGGGNE
jgi:hypothetical protein